MLSSSNMQKIIYKKIDQEIHKAKRVLLLSHVSPDGDCIGAALAFQQILKNFKKEVVVFNLDNFSELYNYLPDFYESKTEINILKNDFDLIITLDCGNMNRTGIEEYLQKINTKIINIDHHITNNNFGDINLVEIETSSTCEMLYDLFKKLNYKMDNKTASCLLTGIVLDTNNFNNSNTSDATVRVSGELIKLGANSKLILDRIYRQSKILDLKLWGKVLKRLNIDEKNNMATTAVFLEDLEEEGLGKDALDGITVLLSSLNDVDSSLILKESEDGINGSLRTNRDDVDVSKIAAKYGGGGHKKASGFFTAGKIVQDKDGVWGVEK